jgi:hypothetical protein
MEKITLDEQRCVEEYPLCEIHPAFFRELVH